MRLSLIREATIDQIKNKIPIWTKKYFSGDEQLAKHIPDIIMADPTRGKYSEWLIKQWKNQTARFPEDTSNLNKNLELFHQKKSKLQNKDINSYTPSSLAKVLDQAFDLTKSERKNARKGGMQLPIGSELIVDDGDLKAVKITTPEASSILCSGTEWCVANKETAKEYLDAGSLYLFYVGGERKYLVHIELNQFMDVYDAPVEEYIKWRLVKVLEPEIGPIIRYPRLAIDYASSVIGGRWPEAEPMIIKDSLAGSADTHEFNPEVARCRLADDNSIINYVMKVIRGRWLEAEPTIMKDPYLAYDYARDVIKGRWPEAEPTIMKNPYLAHDYCKEVLKGRWPEAEPEIAKNGELAYYYARDVIKGRWPEVEPEIAKNEIWAYAYAKNVIKGRWPEAEPTIIKSPHDDRAYSYYYAKDVIKGRWPEAEPEIAKDARWAYFYARDVIKGRWPEAEPTIMKNPSIASYYAENVIKGRWPEG